MRFHLSRLAEQARKLPGGGTADAAVKGCENFIHVG